MRDIYRDITDSIAGAVEAGAGKYEMPWHRGSGGLARPTNACTKNAYSGVNVLTLWVRAERSGYESGVWATYKQWEMLHAQVRKGEKGARIVFYKKTEAPRDAAPDDPESKARLLLRTSSVFAAEQVDGYSVAKSTERSLVQILAGAEAAVVASKAEIREGGDRAFYNPGNDYIQMPLREKFTGSATSNATESYYSVLLHELTHWTGHKTRLARDFSGRFGDQAYAVEELVAELGAAFLCADLGVSNEPRADHAAYVASWLTVLANDSRAIFTAASKASAAAEFVMRRKGSVEAGEEPA